MAAVQVCHSQIELHLSVPVLEGVTRKNSEDLCLVLQSRHNSLFFFHNRAARLMFAISCSVNNFN